MFGHLSVKKIFLKCLTHIVLSNDVIQQSDHMYGLNADVLLVLDRQSDAYGSNVDVLQVLNTQIRLILKLLLPNKSLVYNTQFINIAMNNSYKGK